MIAPRIAAFLVAATTLLTAAAPQIEIPLNGGKIIPRDATMVMASPGDMNFCFAKRFSNGVIHLSHTAGVHTVDEHGVLWTSSDDGQTWQPSDDKSCFAMNAFEDRQGRICRLECWSNEQTTEHQIYFEVLNADGKGNTQSRRSVLLPFECSLRIARELRRLKDGRLLAPCHGRRKGARAYQSMLLVSNDDGESWEYLSTVATADEVKTVEGANESAVIELADGRLLYVYRIGGKEGLEQKYSTDGGRTWGPAQRITDYGASPQLLLMQNGTLLLLSGRPGLYVLVDFTGTGEHYQRVTLHDGPDTSSYASFCEIAPDELLLVRDITNFASICRSRLMNYVVAERMAIVLEPACRITSSDPQGEGFDVFYSGFDGKLPVEFGGFIDEGYAQHAAAGASSAAIDTVPEYPQPILRLVHHGKTQEEGRGNGYRHLLDSSTGKLTIQASFRLLEGDVEKPQLALQGTVQQGKKQRRALCGFAHGYIDYLDNGQHRKFPMELGIHGKFHRFTMKLDAVTDQWQLFYGDSDKPLFTAKLSVDEWYGPLVLFGATPMAVEGSVEVASVGWKAGK